MSENAANSSPGLGGSIQNDSSVAAQPIDSISPAINIPGKLTAVSDEPDQFSLLNDTMLSNQSLHRRSAVHVHLQLPGEIFEDSVDLAKFRLVFSKYRLLIVGADNFVCSVPLLMIETIEARDNAFVMVCRDGRHIRVPIAEKDALYIWTRNLLKTSQQRDYADIFAFHLCAALSSLQSMPNWLRRTVSMQNALQRLEAELRHFKLERFRISSANVEFKICESYPQHLIVSESLSDEDLFRLREARTANRIPTVAWAHGGRTLIRASQPVHTLWNGFQCNFKDVSIMEKYQEALQETNSNFVYFDLRSYSAALANFAKGGGYETTDAYKGVVQFKGMPNIHNIRQSFASLRMALNTQDTNQFLQNLQATNWFQYMLLTFDVADEVLNVMLSGRSILVHCTDGWDRTSQICALCMLIGDPYYRTFEGFESLIQRQWVEFGHKFGDRSNVLNISVNSSEVSPIFLQFLDCVHQLWNRNPDAFEFNRRYLVKLSQHVYSGLFSTFLFNNLREAAAHGCAQMHEADGSLSAFEQKAFPIWNYLGRHNVEFINPLFREPLGSSHARLSVPTTIKDLDLWRDAYCCTAAQQFLNKTDFLPNAPANSNGDTTNGNGDTANGNGDTANGKCDTANGDGGKPPFDASVIANPSSPLGSSTKHNVSTPPSSVVSQKPTVDVEQVSPSKSPNGTSNSDTVPNDLSSNMEDMTLTKTAYDASSIVEKDAKRVKTNDQDQFPSMISTSQHTNILLSSSNNGNLKSQASESYRFRTSSESFKSSGKRSNGSVMDFINKARRGLDDDGMCRIPILVEDQMVDMFATLKASSRVPHSALPTMSLHENSVQSDKLFINGHGNGHTNLPFYHPNGYHPTFNGTTTTTNGVRLYYTTTASTSAASLSEHQLVGSHLVNGHSTRRVRNESIDSVHAVGFEFIDEVEPHFNSNHQRRKHDSSGSLSQSYGQSPGMNFTMEGVSSRSSSRNPRHSTPVNERSEDEISIVQAPSADQFDSASNGSSLERGTLFRSSAASVTSLQAVRSIHAFSSAMSGSRSELNGMANAGFTSPVKNATAGKLFNGGKLSGSANSLDETIRPKGQTVAG